MGAPGAPKTTPKHTKSLYFVKVFCTPISECLLARIVAETGSELHDTKTMFNCAGASGSHVGRFVEKSSRDHIFQGFWCRLRCRIEPLGSLWAHDGTFCSPLAAKVETVRKNAPVISGIQAKLKSDQTQKSSNWPAI